MGRSDETTLLPSYDVQGKHVKLPVFVRDARSGAATYLVKSAPARALLSGKDFELADVRAEVSFGHATPARREHAGMEERLRLDPGIVGRRRDGVLPCVAERQREIRRPDDFLQPG